MIYDCKQYLTLVHPLPDVVFDQFDIVKGHKRKKPMQLRVFSLKPESETFLSIVEFKIIFSPTTNDSIKPEKL